MAMFIPDFEYEIGIFFYCSKNIALPSLITRAVISGNTIFIGRTFIKSVSIDHKQTFPVDQRDNMSWRTKNILQNQSFKQDS